MKLPYTRALSAIYARNAAPALEFFDFIAMRILGRGI